MWRFICNPPSLGLCDCPNIQNGDAFLPSWPFRLVLPPLVKVLTLPMETSALLVLALVGLRVPFATKLSENTRNAQYKRIANKQSGDEEVGEEEEQAPHLSRSCRQTAAPGRTREPNITGVDTFYCFRGRVSTRRKKCFNATNLIRAMEY